MSKPTTKIFSDVSLDQWYAPFIQKAYNTKIIAGYKENTFKPNKDVNWAEALKIAVETYIKANPNQKLPNIESGDWYTPYLEYAISKKIIDQSPNPEAKINRSEAANLITRLWQLR